MANNRLTAYFDNKNLDIRISHDGTWIDQKCTPDVVCFVADCIVNFINDKVENGEAIEDVRFTIKDIWGQEYSKENMGMFGKPDVKMNSNEYDKFFSQPIKLLNYSEVIGVKDKKRGYIFGVNNFELLEYISARDNNALNFLAAYIEKVLKDSDVFDTFEKFFKIQDEGTFNDMKEAFVNFMFINTNRGNKGGDNKDCYRIFTKVINPLAFVRKTKGTIKGRLSKDIIQREELNYNRKNFRDILTNKPKNETRAEQEIVDCKSNYEIQKAKNRVRKYNEKHNNGLSESYLNIANSLINIDDNFEKIETYNLGTEMHHIFPKASYPEIASYLENLIALSPNQHFLKAHPKNNTQVINRDYQYYLLLCKIERIKQNLLLEEKYHIYSFIDLLFVLSTGLKTDSFNTVKTNDFNSVICMVSEAYQ